MSNRTNTIFMNIKTHQIYKKMKNNNNEYNALSMKNILDHQFIESWKKQKNP